MSVRMSSRVLRSALLASLGLAMLGAGGVRAGDGHDHDLARQAMAAGEVLPLRTILQKIERDHPGQIMEVELEHHDGGWRYEIKLLRTGGTLVKLQVDARDGRLLAVKTRAGNVGKER